MEVQVINHQRTATFQANLRRGMKLFQVESVATIAPIDISASEESAVAPVKTNDSSDDASNLVILTTVSPGGNKAVFGHLKTK